MSIGHSAETLECRSVSQPIAKALVFQLLKEIFPYRVVSHASSTTESLGARLSKEVFGYRAVSYVSSVAKQPGTRLPQEAFARRIIRRVRLLLAWLG